MNNIEILQETLQILDTGKYIVNGKEVKLQLSKERMEASHVLLPADVQDICGRKLNRSPVAGTCRIDCVKQDSYVAAIELMRDRPNAGDQSKPVLVLNFANPVNILAEAYTRGQERRKRISAGEVRCSDPLKRLIHFDTTVITESFIRIWALMP